MTTVKNTPKPSLPWLDRIGIDKSCRLVGMCRGMITLTKAHDIYTLWIYDYPLMTGEMIPVRERYNFFALTA
jgi:hypothetical protein